MRALRVLLACLVLALSARPSAPVVWSDPIALVAPARATAAPGTPEGARSPGAPPPHADQGRAPAPGQALAPWREPAGTTRDRVLVPRRYLRNLALLC